MAPALPFVFSMVWKEALGLSRWDPKKDPGVGGPVLPGLVEGSAVCATVSY